MKRSNHFRAVIAGLVWVAYSGSALAKSTTAIVVSSPSEVAAWNEQALRSIRASSTPPPKASRILAILHASIHDAYNGIAGTYQQYYVTTGLPGPNASKEAAVAVAAHDVLAAAFPARVDEFDSEMAAQLGQVPNGALKTAGMNFGRAVAVAIMTSRASDGASSVVTYSAAPAPGVWRPTPGAFAAALLPQWGNVVPFGITDAARYVPAAPPALNSSQYRFDFDQVKALGSAASTVRTPDQTIIARFWANGAGTSTPPGHWNQIARIVVRQLGMGVADEARLFALLNIAMADAAIVAWKTKYQYNYWRPITAIREAASDGNPATSADPTWTPLLATPPFPEYVSGHSTFSGAAAMVLERVTGQRNFSFVATSDDAPGISRPYPDFRTAAAESGMSRIYGGIHFWSANEQGLKAGGDIGKDVVNRWLQPVGGGPGRAPGGSRTQ